MLLMRKHGDIKAEPDFKDSDGRTPLSWAAENGHETVAKLLIETDGVMVDSKDTLGRTHCRLQLKKDMRVWSNCCSKPTRQI